MLKIRNLCIIGTSHVARQSVREVEAFITKNRPGIIALELDKNRYRALKLKRKNYSLPLSMRITASLAGLIQKKLGKMAKSKAGSEMTKAINLAGKYRARIEFIDQDISTTLRKAISRITLREKIFFLVDTIATLLSRKIDIDLKKVPEDKAIKELTGHFRQRYPTLYQILVEERNSVMAKNLYNLMISNKSRKILAVVGAGHQKEIARLVKCYLKNKK